MARPIWSGAINFGLVSVPVALYSATRDHTVQFRQTQRGTSDRVRYKRVNERTGKEVDYEDIVKGREAGDGKYIVVEPTELEAVSPGRSRTLDISTFVDLDEIDPIFFQKTYWLAPGKDGDPKPYALLVKAMEKTSRVGIGNFVMRGKEYLAAIRPDDGVLSPWTRCSSPTRSWSPPSNFPAPPTCVRHRARSWTWPCPWSTP